MDLNEARKTLSDAGFNTTKSKSLTKKQFKKEACKILAKLVGNIIDMTADGISQAFGEKIDIDSVWDEFGGKETVIDLFAKNEDGPLNEYVEKLWELSNQIKE